MGPFCETLLFASICLLWINAVLSDFAVQMSRYRLKFDSVSSFFLKSVNKHDVMNWSQLWSSWFMYSQCVDSQQRRMIYWSMLSPWFWLALWNIDLSTGTFRWISKCYAVKAAVYEPSAGISAWKISGVSGPITWRSMAFFLGFWITWY